METLPEDDVQVLLPLQVVEDVSVEVVVAVLGTRLPPVAIEHGQVEEVGPELLHPGPVLLVVPPAQVCGLPHQTDLYLRHDVTRPQCGVLVYLDVQSCVPGPQGVELGRLTRSLPALDGVNVGVLVD